MRETRTTSKELGRRRAHEKVDSSMLIELIEYYHYWRFHKHYEVADWLRDIMMLKGFKLIIGANQVMVIYGVSSATFEMDGMHVDYKHAQGAGVLNLLLTKWRDIG